MKSTAKNTLYLLVTLITGFIFSTGESATELYRSPYPEHLPGTFTGGFAEETCRSCHFDYPLNYEEGSLRVDGLPERYEQGKTYRLKIAVGRPDLKKAGFQLTARFPDSSRAGRFRVNSDRILIAEFDSGSVQFVQHAAMGTEPTEKSKAEWSLEWIAPDSRTSDVLVNIAANAANGDVSEFGDYIMAREIRIPSRK